MKNVILHLPDWLTKDSDQRNSKQAKVTVLFFITGNPGLIGYYDEFLALLAQSAKGRECVIAGASLGGFDVKTSLGVDQVDCSGASNESTKHDTAVRVENLQRELLLPTAFGKKRIYNLRDQIDLSYRRLSGLIESLRKNFTGICDANFKVILAGHSVGAYIALELVRLHYEKRLSNPEATVASFNILATFLLTPTIHDIGQSPSGRVASPVLSYLPFFPNLVQFGASGLSTVLSRSWLRSVVQRVTGMQNPNAVDATTEFLGTPGTVEQALHLAACEMREIGEDKWTNEVWGAVEDTAAEDEVKIHGQWIAPKHFFLFAKQDHWVANVTREAIADKMRQRAVVFVDSDGKLGLDHAWCLQQSDVVAGIVNGWMDQVLD